jgi:TRAP-type mannitol/chloroaromatic compound transport system substrate-binding protein
LAVSSSTCGAGIGTEAADALEAAGLEAQVWMVAKYDAANPAALRRLVAGGAKLHPFPREVMQACWQSANKLYDETASKNPKFKKIYEPWKKFRDEEILWFQVVEQSFDNYMAAASRKS